MLEMLDKEILGIIALTMRMTLLSTAISSLLGIPLGLWLSRADFPGKGIVVLINRTLMASPPVVIGLLVYLLLMRNGPFGFLGLLFSFEAMVVAQTLLLTPIICGIVYTASQRSAAHIRTFAITMGATKWQTKVLLIKELSNEIYFAMITGFGRAMSEVGAIMIVGGNIRYHTRVMTTTISLLRNRGEINQAIFLGIILMLIAFAVQLIAGILRKKERRTDENF
ncbi:MAG: ABC transporter permease [Oscillospiraceae bacterium]|jgi:tungstate transport system permease protein|nr:ABC transporter permease [Oscillospiraceae bacterium]